MNDRFDEVKADADEHSDQHAERTAENFRQCVIHKEKECSIRGVNLEDDSDRVAKFLVASSPDPAARILSRDLRQLSGEHYNDLLVKTVDKEAALLTDGDYPPPPHLVLSDFNPDTGTWNMVEIENRHFPEAPPIRFVQPQNTLSEIARDRLAQLRFGGCDGEGCKITQSQISEAVNDIARENKIADINKIFVGQALTMPY